MNTKLTIQHMRKIAREHGGKCLSDKYVTMKTKLLWQCNNGHQWKAQPSDVSHGHWCPYCAGNAKRTIGEMQKLAEEKGGKCLSKKYKGTHVKLKWQCEKGHRWMARPNTIKRNHWCPTCFDNRRGKSLRKYTMKDMHDLAKKHGGKCLSEGLPNKYIKTKDIFLWECGKGHHWKGMPFQMLYNDTWCSICGHERGGKKLRMELEKIIEYAQKKHPGCKCLSTEYIDSKTKLIWQCENGHPFFASANSIIHGGYWCYECSPTKRKTIEYWQKFAEARCGKCLSTEYIDNKTKLIWQCGKGHLWEARPGHWCPYCNESVSEKTCRLYLETILQKKFPLLYPDWLKSPMHRGHQHLDGFNQQLNVAFEFNGKQHYHPYERFRGNEGFEIRKKLDIQKARLCKKQGVILLKIPYNRNNPIFIRKLCMMKGIKIPSKISKLNDYELGKIFLKMEV